MSIRAGKATWRRGVTDATISRQFIGIQEVAYSCGQHFQKLLEKPQVVHGRDLADVSFEIGLQIGSMEELGIDSVNSRFREKPRNRVSNNRGGGTPALIESEFVEGKTEEFKKREFCRPATP